MNAAAEDEPASFTNFRPGVLLVDRQRCVIATLPLAAWPQVWAWFRDPRARPIRFRDAHSGITCVDRAMVAIVERRDVESCVVLERMERERTWSEGGA